MTEIILTVRRKRTRRTRQIQQSNLYLHARRDPGLWSTFSVEKLSVMVAGRDCLLEARLPAADEMSLWSPRRCQGCVTGPLHCELNWLLWSFERGLKSIAESPCMSVVREDDKRQQSLTQSLKSTNNFKAITYIVSCGGRHHKQVHRCHGLSGMLDEIREL